MKVGNTIQCYTRSMLNIWFGHETRRAPAFISSLAANKIIIFCVATIGRLLLHPISAAAALANAAVLPQQSAEITKRFVSARGEKNAAEIYIIELNGSCGASKLGAFRLSRIFFNGDLHVLWEAGLFWRWGCLKFSSTARKGLRCLKWFRGFTSVS